MSVVARSVCSAPSTVMVTPGKGRLVEPPPGPGANSEANTWPLTAVPGNAMVPSVSKLNVAMPPACPSPSASKANPLASRRPLPSKVTWMRALAGRSSR
jgi:hypothetical protein